MVLVLGLAACGDDGDDTSAGDNDPTTTTAGDTGGDAAGGSTVEAADFSFTSITVTAGAEVGFENTGAKPHTMTADDGAFDSGNVAGGSSTTLTAPSEPGAYAFHCEIHPSMTGTLTVEG